MQWRARVIAPVMAAVLGVTGGAATALLADGSAGRARDGAQRSFDDPDNVGAPMVNVPCTNQYLVVLAHGFGQNALGNAVASDDKVRYLETAASCDTRYGPDSDPHPTLVAYRGPYADVEDACTLRMQSNGSYVVTLTAGDQQLVKCPCRLPWSAAPRLSVDTRPTTADNVWARALQTMFRDYAAAQGQPLTGPKAPPKITGRFDELTRRWVSQRFQLPAGLLGRNGVVDAETWRVIDNRICPIYDPGDPGDPGASGSPSSPSSPSSSPSSDPSTTPSPKPSGSSAPS